MKLILKLNNPQEEADSIREALRHADISVVAEDGKTVLITESLVEGKLDLTDSVLLSDTWERVHDLIAIINGAARIEGAALNRVALLHIAYVDAQGRRQHMPNIGKAYIVLPVLRSRLPDPSPFISIALSDRAAARALCLFSHDLDWVNLYRIYEVIAEDVNNHNIINRGWATQEETRAFTASANNASVTGEHSRHGKLNNSRPRHTIQLADARHLIGRILREWLNSKVTAHSGAT
jgi:hypothetical protein